MNEKTYLIKLTINSILKIIVTAEKNGTELFSDNELCKILKVGRTSVSEAISYLCDEQIIERKKNGKTILRLPQDSDYFDLDSCKPTKQCQIEAFFLNLIMSGDLMPGDKFSELELAKNSGCTTTTVREFLTGFSSNGLIVKIPRSGWKIVELDEELIVELTEFRGMVEKSSINKLLKLSQDNPVWDVFRDILIQHQEVRDDFEQRYGEFHQLDKRFQRAIQDASKNRFTNKFFDFALFISHYYFLWNKDGKLASIKIAIEQQIELLTYLLSRDVVNVILVMEKHMKATRKNLLVCVKNINKKNAISS
jgi:DNA-binding GntR family transcriptional regulator